jgi:hypothetical protein
MLKNGIFGLFLSSLCLTLETSRMRLAAHRPRWPHQIKEDLMTDATMSVRLKLRLVARHLSLWLAPLRRRQTPTAHFDKLSDHVLRDIGAQRNLPTLWRSERFTMPCGTRVEQAGRIQ